MTADEAGTLRVLALMHPELVPPDHRSTPRQRERTFDTGRPSTTCSRRCAALGHEVQRARRAATSCCRSARPSRRSKPHVVFNLLEEFHGDASFDQHVVSYLELLARALHRLQPRGLMLARDKALSKKLLAYHRIPAPAFAVFPRGRSGAARRASLRVPAHREEPHRAVVARHRAGVGGGRRREAGRARALRPRAARHRRHRRAVHRGPRAVRRRARQRPAAGAAGLGAARSTTCRAARSRSPPRASSTTSSTRRSAASTEARGAAAGASRAAHRSARSQRIYRILELDGYARLDYRLAADGTLYFLEANPNPDIAEREEFAAAARAAGIAYPDLLDRILNLGLGRGA